LRIPADRDHPGGAVDDDVGRPALALEPSDESRDVDDRRHPELAGDDRRV